MIVVNPRNHRVKNAIFRVQVQLDEVQLWNLKGLEKLDFIKCP